MKKLIYLALFSFIFAQVSYAYTSWENNPYNWDNSENNWDNSSKNRRNSPYNWDNSPYNPNANIIYDNNGKPQEYAVQKPNGKGVNVYDFKGKRQGYYNY